MSTFTVSSNPQVMLCDEFGDRMDGPMPLHELLKKYECPFEPGSEDYDIIMIDLRDEGLHQLMSASLTPCTICLPEAWHE